MITITRRQARRLRGVFRRHPLGIAHRGPVPPLVLRADRHADSASDTATPPWPSSTPCRAPTGPSEAIALPLDALADFEGRTTRRSSWRPPRPTAPSPAGTTAASRRPASTPSPPSTPCRRSPTRPPPSRPARPACSTPWPRRPRRPTTVDPVRPGLPPAQGRRRRGRRHRRPAAPRSRAASASPGTATCWSAARPLFACKELPRDRPVAVGRTDTHVVLRARRLDALAGRSRPTPASRGSSTSSPTPRPRPPGCGSTPATPRSWPARSTGCPGPTSRTARRPSTSTAGSPSGPGAPTRTGSTELVLARSGYTGAAGPAQRQPRVPGPGGPARLRRGRGRRRRLPRRLPRRPPAFCLAAAVEGVGDRAGRRRHPDRVRPTTPARPVRPDDTPKARPPVSERAANPALKSTAGSPPPARPTARPRPAPAWSP